MDNLKLVLEEEYEGNNPTAPEEAAILRVHPIWGRWNPKRISQQRPLRIGFTAYNSAMVAVVERAAKEWADNMDMGINFAENNLDILIDFDGDGNNSALGVSSRFYAQAGVPSLKLQRDLYTFSDQIQLGITIHELGHALGLIHEHQNPEAGIDFNEEAVFNYFHHHYKWDKEKTRNNVLNRYSLHGKYAVGARTEFDPKSIMMYYLPASLLNNSINGFGVNYQLSNLDKVLIDNVY
jgi:hypothetical protein